jgi:hypothetical protein
LKKRFNILVILGCSYSQRTLDLIMCDCIILYNMIIDYERDNSFDEKCAFQLLKKNVQYTSYHWTLSVHSWFDNASLHYFTQYDYWWWESWLIQWELSHYHSCRWTRDQLQCTIQSSNAPLEGDRDNIRIYVFTTSTGFDWACGGTNIILRLLYFNYFVLFIF